MKDTIRKFLKTAIFFIVFLFIGFLCGLMMGKSLAAIDNTDEMILPGILVLFVIWLYFSMFLQIAAHEWGHYLFGRITGYRFASFRLGSYILIRMDRKLRIKRFSLAGTGGQCLMDPPEMKDGRIPYVLYNLGGVIINLLLGLAAAVLACLLRLPAIADSLLWIFSIIGFAFALMNGIPLQAGMVNNDGHNALSLGKNTDALRSFWIQMKGNVLTGQGIRTKDMPADWFTMPDDEGLQNPMTAVLAVLACSRKMDEGELDAADVMMEKLLSEKNAISELHRRMLICDRIFCLLYHDRPEEASALYDKKQQQFMKSMKQFPSVLRTEYVIALLLEQNPGKADDVMNRFLKYEKIYPYPVEFQSEQELLELVNRKANRAAGFTYTN